MPTLCNITNTRSGLNSFPPWCVLYAMRDSRKTKLALLSRKQTKDKKTRHDPTPSRKTKGYPRVHKKIALKLQGSVFSRREFFVVQRRIKCINYVPNKPSIILYPGSYDRDLFALSQAEPAFLFREVPSLRFRLLLNMDQSSPAKVLARSAIFCLKVFFVAVPGNLVKFSSS